VVFYCQRNIFYSKGSKNYLLVKIPRRKQILLVKCQEEKNSKIEFVFKDNFYIHEQININISADGHPITFV